MGQQMDETYGPFQFREHKMLQAGVVSDTDSKLLWKQKALGLLLKNSKYVYMCLTIADE